ncbi:hypothetical protein VTK56DRAFT_6636 [Thermocarpiscus australiensis]
MHHLVPLHVGDATHGYPRLDFRPAHDTPFRDLRDYCFRDLGNSSCIRGAGRQVELLRRRNAYRAIRYYRGSLLG